MKEQALIGARGLVSPSLCIPVLQSVSCYRGGGGDAFLASVVACSW